MLVRCVFWFSLVAALVPYREFDVPHARFAVDQNALLTALARLPHYCRDHGPVCEKAAALTNLIGTEGLAFVKETAVRLQAQSKAGIMATSGATTDRPAHG